MAIPGDGLGIMDIPLMHTFVVAGIDRKKMRKVVKMAHGERRKICLLKDVKMKKRLMKSN